LRAQPVQAVASATSQNFLRLFRPPASQTVPAGMFPAGEGNRIM
jgi:hypothetical protein